MIEGLVKVVYSLKWLALFVKMKYMKTLLLKNVDAFLANEKVNNILVLIENEKIAGMFFENKNIKADEEIDLSGKTLFAGFIDIHIHGAVGVDTNETDVDGLQNVARFLAQNGVTAWLPTLVPDSEENYQRSINAIDELMKHQEESLEPSARVLGVHYEGPFVNEKQCGALRTQFFKSFVKGDEVKSLPRLRNFNAIHLTTLAPEIEGGVELIRELVKENWIVSIGHTRSTVEMLEQAFDAGAKHITHFMNAMPQLHHRAPGVVGWGLLKDDVMCDMIADGIHTDALMLKLALRCKTSDKLALISDAVSPTGLGDGDYEIWGEKISVVNGKTQNERGSIAGSVITMLDAVRFMLKLGINETDVSKMASLNPARTLGIDKDYGSIEIGKRADLVAIDENGNVQMTIIGGRVAH